MSLSEEQVSSLMSTYLNSTEGHNSLAMSMMKPLMQRRGYAGLAKKIFTVDVPIAPYEGIPDDLKVTILSCAPEEVCDIRDIYVRGGEHIVYRSRSATSVSGTVLVVRIDEFKEALLMLGSIGPEEWVKYVGDKETAQGLVCRAKMAGRLDP